MVTACKRIVRAIPAMARCAITCAVAACGGGADSGLGSLDGALPRFDYPAAIDSSYGDAGYRVYSTGLGEKVYLGSFNVSDFIIDRAGRAVVVGTRSSADREAWILRLLADGSPDPSCGKSGWSSFTTGGPATPRRIAQLPDGRYVLGGILGVPSVWALREDCTIDVTFGKNGQAVLQARSPTEVQGGVNALAIDEQGRVLATAGSTLSGKLFLARFTPQGIPDVTFGAGAGFVSLAPSDGASPQPSAIAVRPDGRVLVAATMAYNSQVGFWAGFVQVLADGSLDKSFGTEGFVSIRPIPNYVVTSLSMILLADGSAIQAGLTQPGVIVGTLIATDAYWLKVNADGQVASTFGNNGLIIWDASPSQRRSSSNYVTSMLDDGEGFFSCQNWINNTKVGDHIEVASLQVLMQRRSSATGEPTTWFAAGGTGFLPRQDDLPTRCIGVRRDTDGRVLVLLDFGPAERATAQTFALVRVSQ